MRIQLRDEHIAGWPAIAHSSGPVRVELEEIHGVDGEDEQVAYALI